MNQSNLIILTPPLPHHQKKNRQRLCYALMLKPRVGVGKRKKKKGARCYRKHWGQWIYSIRRHWFLHPCLLQFWIISISSWALLLGFLFSSFWPFILLENDRRKLCHCADLNHQPWQMGQLGRISAIGYVDHHVGGEDLSHRRHQLLRFVFRKPQTK